MHYTDEYIKELLSCEKFIETPPLKEMKLDRGMFKNNFTLQSKDKKFDFKVFMRINEKFRENFSIGLEYNPKDEKGTVTLIRMNGQHGENLNFPHHNTFHIHVASASSINNGLKPESNIEVTNKYASYDEALQYFLIFIKLNKEDIAKYFPPPKLTLFGQNGRS